MYAGTSAVLGFAGGCMLLVTGRPPTDDEPTVSFAAPDDPDRVSHAMTLRVTDCWAVYQALRARGATFQGPPHDWGHEIRACTRDLDGHLVELS